MDIFADLDEIITEADMRPGVDFEDDTPPPAMYVEICQKCRGSGVYTRSSRHGQTCFACKGKGKFERKTSPQVRERAKVNTAARKVATADRQLAAWIVANPAQGVWVVQAAGRGFGFAVAMVEALRKWGHLTDRQQATVDRLMAQDAERAARKAAEAAGAVDAPSVTIAKIEEAFASAKASGIKYPKLRLDTFKFSPAPASGKNAGAVYVKEGEEYRGKITGGKFVRAFTCDEVTEARVVEVASDPMAAAVAYGKRYGSCSCCGRELSNQASIDLGIGPICAGKYGW